MESIEKVIGEIEKYELVLFDFDETLFETQVLHKKAYSIAKQNNNNSEKIYEEKCKIFLNLIEESVPKIVPLTFLIYLFSKNKNKKTAIISATKIENIEKTINHCFYNFDFDKVYAGAKLENKNKPNPFMIDSAVSYFNVSKSKTIILEDSEIGFETAKNANIDCFNVKDRVFYYNSKKG